MAGVTTAVVGTALAIKGQMDAKKARQSAARKQEAAAQRSAELVGRAGAASEREIAQQERLARRDIQTGARRAEQEIAPFTEAARGFDVAKQLTMSGQPISGPMADAIRLGAMRGAEGAAFSPIAQSIQPEVQRQAQLAVSAATPEARQAMLNQGTVGIGAVGDISQIRGRKFDALADLASGAAGQRASALVGAAPQLTQLAGSAAEAGVLSSVAGQRARTGTMEQLARLAGRVT